MEQQKPAEKKDEKLKLKQIRNGIVIDHIMAGKAFEVLRILGIKEGYTDAVSVAMNVYSKQMNKKDIVKVENREIVDEEINKIAILAPKATINRIVDYQVIKKENVVLPNEIVGIVKCQNPQCISNKDREPIKSVFLVVQREPLILSCKYCEREVKEKEVKKGAEA